MIRLYVGYRLPLAAAEGLYVGGIDIQCGSDFLSERLSASLSCTESADAPVDTVLFPYTTGQLGGSHISGTSLASGLAERFGLRSIVIAPEGAEVIEIARDMGLETMATREVAEPRHRPHRELMLMPGRFSTLRKFGRRTIVHCNDLAALQSWGVAAKALGIPALYHNRAFDKNIWPNRTVIRMAQHVISISAVCDARLDYIAKSRRSVVTNPFSTPLETDFDAARAVLLRDLGAPDDAKIVGFVGNFWPRKRPEFFIEVAARLAAQDDRLRFVLFGRAGDISVETLERRVGEAGLGGRVLMAGFRLPPEANLAALDLLLMPALDEPFGRTLVESLLLGVPYVAADDAGHSEIHRRWGGGIMVPADGSVEDYAAACRTAISAPDSVRLPIDRRRTVAAELTPRHHAADVMEVYRRLLS
jgi:glycosyltransferase involved in cell wall biosynthesis